jgi:hypothetical protein
MADSIEDLRTQAQKLAEREADLQKRLSATRGEIDAAETAGEVEEKRRLNAELLAVREQLEQVQFERGFLHQKLTAAESGKEAAREFQTRIFARI